MRAKKRGGGGAKKEERGGRSGQEDLRRLNKNGTKNRPSDKKQKNKNWLWMCLKCGDEAGVKRRPDCRN